MSMENISPNTYWDLFLGYTAFWLLIGSFCFYLMREQQRLAQRFFDCEREIRAKDAASFENERGANPRQQMSTAR